MYRGVLIMTKNLPNVYAVPITKKINNNKETFTSKQEDRKVPISKEEITRIFTAKDHVYKTKVRIKTRTETKEVDVVGETNEALLTLNGERINIQDILEIKKV